MSSASFRQFSPRASANSRSDCLPTSTTVLRLFAFRHTETVYKPGTQGEEENNHRSVCMCCCVLAAAAKKAERGEVEGTTPTVQSSNREHWKNEAKILQSLSASRRQQPLSQTLSQTSKLQLTDSKPATEATSCVRRGRSGSWKETRYPGLLARESRGGCRAESTDMLGMPPEDAVEAREELAPTG